MDLGHAGRPQPRYAAGRGRCRSRWRAASSRAFRRESSATTFAGRATACVGRVATLTRCRCISPPLVCLWSVPESPRHSTKRQAKSAAYCAASITPCRIGWEGRSLELFYVVFKPGITSFLSRSPPKRRRRPFGSPSIRWLCAWLASLRASDRGPERCRRAARRTSAARTSRSTWPARPWKQQLGE